MASLSKSELTLKDVVSKVNALSEEVRRSNEKFDARHRAIRQMVQLSFGLMASVTVIVIVINVLI